MMWREPPESEPINLEARGLVYGLILALIFWVLIVALALLLQAIT